MLFFPKSPPIELALFARRTLWIFSVKKTPVSAFINHAFVEDFGVRGSD